jgi:hypothetical protein
MSVVRCLEVSLTIPDNEAETALATLRRLGLELGELHRADIYRVELDEPAAKKTLAGLRKLETIYNPNKHRLNVRSETEPHEGEVWIDEPGPEATGDGSLSIAGKVLEGLRRIERFTAWRLLDAQGNPASPQTVTRASDLLLCNSAFQRAQLSR